jgi:hypothetical protein
MPNQQLSKEFDAGFDDVSQAVPFTPAEHSVITRNFDQTNRTRVVLPLRKVEFFL